jgi:GNAT superfamily N-acetyltransferase
MMATSTFVAGEHSTPIADLSFAPILPTEALGLRLREDLLDTWVAVTDAGGAVGFTAPADVAAVESALDSALGSVAAGRDVLGILRHGRTAVGMGFLVDRGSAVQQHWRTVLRVMVRPELQGSGGGRLLLEGLHRIARSRGLEQLQLTVRGGTGVERFYQRFGYTVVGSHPGAVRVAPGDDRDEIMMVVSL